ncbi:hypothetical protein L209DRAFT_615864 [Thermothelomyces heterothallicus CBS 203.75]
MMLASWIVPKHTLQRAPFSSQPLTNKMVCLIVCKNHRAGPSPPFTEGLPAAIIVRMALRRLSRRTQSFWFPLKRSHIRIRTYHGPQMMSRYTPVRRRVGLSTQAEASTRSTLSRPPIFPLPKSSITCSDMAQSGGGNRE